MPLWVLADVLLIGHMAGALSLGAMASLSATLGLYYSLTGAPDRTRRSQTVGTAQASIQMAALGGLGMLLGLVFDAGPLGVLGLVTICNASQASMPGLDALLRHLHYMPAASLGMLAGCTLWAPWSGWDRAGAPFARYARHLLIGLGMLWGMLWAEKLSAYMPAVTNNASLLVALTLTSMLAGMYAGTLAAAWLARGIQSALSAQDRRRANHRGGVTGGRGSA